MNFVAIFSGLVLVLTSGCHSKSVQVEGIRSGYYEPIPSQSEEIPIVSFRLKEEKLFSYEVKRVIWPNGERQQTFSTGGYVRNYRSGFIPGSTRTYGNLFESTAYAPQSDGSVRGQLLKRDSSTQFEQTVEIVFREISQDRFLILFQAELRKMFINVSDLDDNKLSSEQIDFCQTNFLKPCKDLYQ